MECREGLWFDRGRTAKRLGTRQVSVVYIYMCVCVYVYGCPDANDADDARQRER
jgi:hypothetical protein